MGVHAYGPRSQEAEDHSLRPAWAVYYVGGSTARPRQKG